MARGTIHVCAVDSIQGACLAGMKLVVDLRAGDRMMIQTALSRGVSA
jgi:hypothetical protein